MKNRVELKDGIINMVQAGDQGYDAVMALNQRVLELAKTIKPVLILVDHTKMGKTNLGARQAAAHVGKTLKFDRMAFYGTKPFEKAIIGFISRATGSLNKIGFFNNRDEAISWLSGSN